MLKVVESYFDMIFVMMLCLTIITSFSLMFTFTVKNYKPIDYKVWIEYRVSEIKAEGG